MQLDITRKFTARSERVKSVDFHPTEPWILGCLYTGHVYIWNYKTEVVLKTFEVTDLPVRTGKFIARKNWIVVGSDDHCISVYNYNTMEKVTSFEAHTDYIRSIAVHPTQPYILSSSDDMQIKLWDWERNWANVQTFEGHLHYVMMVVFNPKDPNTFASASLDRTIKVWGLGTGIANFTLEGHDKGVNCVEYYNGGEKPYIVSGADDNTIKVWDYQNKTCVSTMDGHGNNISIVSFHPSLPLIISGSEDGTVKLWHANTYRLEKTLNYGMERAWALAIKKGTNKVAFGFDGGLVMLKLGSEEPAVSMDPSGKIVWAKQSEIQLTDVKVVRKMNVEDGERLALPIKELGSCEVYPRYLSHNKNGHFIVVCGDGEYIIHTALGLRNRSYGSGLDFVWYEGPGKERGVYCVRESTSKIKIFAQFKEKTVIRPNFSAEKIFGGDLIAVKSSKFVCFYDWEGRVIRKIDVTPKTVVWSDGGEFVAICCESSFYILKFNTELVRNAIDSGVATGDEGIADAFELLHEVTERVRTAQWAADCFVYTNSKNRLNYCVGGEVFTISHLDRQMYLLGYIPRDNKLYLVDKALNLTSYTLHLAVVNYQTAILRGDTVSAEKLLPSIPEDRRDKVARFLESQGLKEDALAIAVDPDHKFDLAIQLGELDLAYQIAAKGESDHKWRQLGDLALANSRFDLAEDCLLKAGDYNGLLLLYSSTANAAGIRKLGELARKSGKYNVAFMCSFLTADVDKALELLCESGRIPEAAFFARTYAPSKVTEIVQLWKKDLEKVNPKAAESLADPMEYENLFPDITYALSGEASLRKEREQKFSASQYLEAKGSLERDVIEEMKALEDEGAGEQLIDFDVPADTPADTQDEEVQEKDTTQETNEEVEEGDEPTQTTDTPDTPAPTDEETPNDAEDIKKDD